MKSLFCKDEICLRRWNPNDVWMKLNPSSSPDKVGFHHEVISSTMDGFIPSERTDLVAPKEKAIPIGMTFLLVREAGLEAVLCQPALRPSTGKDRCFGTISRLPDDLPTENHRRKLCDFHHSSGFVSKVSGVRFPSISCVVQTLHSQVDDLCKPFWKGFCESECFFFNNFLLYMCTISEFRGCHTSTIFKNPGKVLGIVKGQVFGNLRKIQIRVPNQPLCFFNFQSNEISG